MRRSIAFMQFRMRWSADAGSVVIVVVVVVVVALVVEAKEWPSKGQ